MLILLDDRIYLLIPCNDFCLLLDHCPHLLITRQHRLHLPQLLVIPRKKPPLLLHPTRNPRQLRLLHIVLLPLLHVLGLHRLRLHPLHVQVGRYDRLLHRRIDDRNNIQDLRICPSGHQAGQEERQSDHPTPTSHPVRLLGIPAFRQPLNPTVHINSFLSSRACLPPAPRSPAESPQASPHILQSSLYPLRRTYTPGIPPPTFPTGKPAKSPAPTRSSSPCTPVPGHAPY